MYFKRFCVLIPLALNACAADLGGVAGKALVPFAGIFAGSNHTCATLTDGSVWCWGLNDQGQLGLGDTNTRGSSLEDFMNTALSVDLGSDLKAVQIAGGDYHTCARLDDGRLKCWGFNTNGQLGLGNTQAHGAAPQTMGDGLPFVNVGTGRSTLSIAANGNSTCALLDDHTVKCWGFGPNGNNGQGTATDVRLADDSLAPVNLGSGRTAIAITEGDTFTCVILDNASVKCWGANGSGQLGQGTTGNIGAGAGDMASLNSISLGTGRTVKAIAAGRAHACALLDDNSIKCWGDSSRGQLGQNSTISIGAAGGQMGDSLPAINLGSGRTARGIYAHGDRACALLDNGALKCWGGNSYGELGQGDPQDRGAAGGQMGDALLPIDLGVGFSPPRQIAMGGNHSCAFFANARIKCWGFNLFSQLGLGDTVSRGLLSGQMGSALPFVRTPPPLL